MTSASSPPRSRAAAIAEPLSDYFASATHYRAVAGRVVLALRGGRLVLVTGDPPSLPSMSTALRQAANERFTVFEVSSEREMARHGTAGPVPPLFLFEEADRLGDDQIDRICKALAEGAASGAAGVLLAHSSFPDRLRQPPLQSLRDALAGQLRFDELDESETIDFLRHQLETRPRDGEERDRRPILKRALLGLAIVATAAIGALLAVRGFEQADRRNPAPSNGAYVTTAPAPSGPAAAPSTLPAAAAPQQPTAASPAPSQSKAPPLQAAPAVPAPPKPTAVSPPPPPSTAPAPALPQATAAAPAPPPLSTAPAPAPPQATAAAPAPPPPSTAPAPAPETAALMARGDAALTSGDIASARLFYERAAEAGDAAAALRLGATYDPGFLGRAGVRGTPGDPAQAALWYRRARDLGNTAAAERLKSLGQAAR